MTTSTEESKQVAQAFFAAMAAGDGDTIGNLLSDDVSWTFPGDMPFSATHVGKEAVFADLLAQTGPYFEPGHLGIEIHNVLADGPLVVVEYTGRNLTKTGRKYENEYVFVIEVADGQIQKIRAYFDTIYTRELMFG